MAHGKQGQEEAAGVTAQIFKLCHVHFTKFGGEIDKHQSAIKTMEVKNRVRTWGQQEREEREGGDKGSFKTGFVCRTVPKQKRRIKMTSPAQLLPQENGNNVFQF